MSVGTPKLRLVPAREAAPPDELGAAFREYAPYVGAIAFRLLGRDGDVDDVVQEVFLVALRRMGTLRAPAAIKGWLATVTVRVASRKLRMRRLRAMLRLDDLPDYSLVAHTADPEKSALVAQVYRVLDHVPVAQRVAWILRYVEREPLDEVARLCACSLATAKRRIAAAQRVLDEALDHA